MKTSSVLPLLLLLSGCASANTISYQGFPASEFEMNLAKLSEAYVIEVRFAWDKPLGIAFSFLLSPSGEVKGWKRMLSMNGREKRIKLEQESVQNILTAFHEFDWNNPQDPPDPNPEVVHLYPDSVSVTLKKITLQTSKEINLPLPSSTAMRELLIDVGFFESYTEQDVGGNE